MLLAQGHRHTTGVLYTSRRLLSKERRYSQDLNQKLVLIGIRLRLSKEEKIEILHNRIENFKNAIKDPNTFDHDIYNSNSPKRDRIRAWGEALEQLHDLGEYEEDICTISSHIRSQLKLMGLVKAVVWAKQVLPYKYKDTSKIHAEKLLDYEYNNNRDVQHPKKLKSKEEITAINLPYIKLMESNKTLISDYIKILQTHEILSFIPPLEFEEYRTRSRGMGRLVRQSWDGRDKVLPEQLHLLIAGYVEGTKNDAFSKYLKYARQILEITSKQAVRLLSGRVTKVELLYDPRDRKDARRCGFHGAQCGECGSWRVDVKYHSDPPNMVNNIGRDRLFCYACKSWGELKTEKLMTKVV